MKVSAFSDPGNKLWRYPIAFKIIPLLIKTKITPNQISILHLFVGIVASYSLWIRQPFLALLLFEIRSLLDCLDGVLARAKNIQSPIGRAVDAASDAISFILLITVVTIMLIKGKNLASTLFIISSCLLLSYLAALCGTLHDIGRRKISAIIDGNADSVEQDWRESMILKKKSKISLLRKLLILMDDVTIRQNFSKWYLRIKNRLEFPSNTLWSEISPLVKAENISLKARVRPSTIHSISLVGGDNILLIFQIGLLLSAILPATPIEFFLILTIFHCIVYEIVMIVWSKYEIRRIVEFKLK